MKNSKHPQLIYLPNGAFKLDRNGEASNVYAIIAPTPESCCMLDCCDNTIKFLDSTNTARSISLEALYTLLGEDPTTSTKEVTIDVFDSGTAVSTGDGTIGYVIPASMNGMNLINAVAAVNDKGITGATDVMVRRRRAGTNADMLSTPITIGDEFFATDEVIDTTNDDVATGDIIYIDVDTIHSGTAPNGLSVTLEFRLP
jgi:hypothetical protein